MFHRLLLLSVLLNAALIISAHACDRDTATNTLNQARKTADPHTRLALLAQSLAACPTFMGYYVRGQTYLQLNQPEQALTALSHARDYADQPRFEALSLARSAQAQILLANYLTAQKLADTAYNMLQDEPLPDWLKQLRLTIDRQLDGRILDASAIRRALYATRSFSVEGIAEINLRVHFALDADKPDQQGLAQVQELGIALQDFVIRAGYLARIIGHTDTQGDKRYNSHLSQRRAQNVINILETRFPKLRGKLSPQGRGESEPRYTENSETAHRYNRRVEVELYQ